MIAFPYENANKDKSNIEDNEIQRHKQDYKLWDGFFIPPPHQLHTISLQSTKQWYKTSALVTSLKRYNILLPTLTEEDDAQRMHL